MDRKRLLFILLLAALALLTYAKAGDNRYAVDDVPIVLENPLVRGASTDGAEALKIWRSPYWDAERFPERGLYRPLAIQSFRWTHLLFGEAAVGIDHWINIVLHAGNGVLLFLLLCRFGAAPSTATVIAALFLAHPVHSEVVASLVGRTDLLALFFLLIAAIHTMGRTRPWLLSVFCLASLCAKESTVLLLCLLPLFADDPSKRKKTAVAAVAALVVYFALRWLALHEIGVPGIGHNRFGDDFIAGRWTALAFDSYFFQKIVAPLPLLYDYGIGLFKIGGAEANLRAAVSLLFFAGAAALIFRQWRRQGRWTPPLIGALCFFAAILPVSNLPLIIGTPFAERLLYVALPFLGLCLLQPFFCAAAIDGLRLKSSVLLVALLLLPLAAVTAGVQSSAWRDNLSLTERTLENYGDNVDLRIFHAWALVEAGLPDRAFAELDAAAKLNPLNYWPQLERAKLLCITGKKEEAQAALARALALVDAVTGQAIIGELQRQQNCIYR